VPVRPNPKPAAPVASAPEPAAPKSSTPGTYPVADLSQLAPEAVAELVERATQDAEREAVACPHLVSTWDVEDNKITYHGPFTTGLGALTFASQLLEAARGTDPDRRTKLSIEPLLPH